MPEASKIYFLYLDASGDEGWPPPAGQSPTAFYTMFGMAIKHEQWKAIATDLQNLVSKYFPKRNLRPKELHYSELITAKHPYRTLSSQQRQSLADDLFDLVLRFKPVLFAIVVDKLKHYQKYTTPEPPRRIGVSFIIPRFDKFLKRHNEIGCLVLDSEEDKKDKLLRYYVHQSRATGIIRFSDVDWDPFRTQSHFTNIIETCFFTPSELSPVIQIADFCSYATWSRYERAKGYRYNQILGLFDKDSHGNRVGIRIWP